MERAQAGRRRSRGRRPFLTRRSWALLGGMALFALCFCSIVAVTIGGRILDALRSDESQPLVTPTITWAPDSAELTVAVSPVMAPALEEMAQEFNRLKQKTPDGQTMRVILQPLTPEQMVERSLGQTPFQAIAPDSSLWLTQLDQRWARLQAEESGETGGTGGAGEIPARRVSDPVRYAVSPIVIAAWEDAARELGWPDRPIGWREIQRKAQEDPNFKWNHPSTGHAAGLLATLAEFYAAAGVTRNLTPEMATDPEVLAYVREVEATVRFYGEGEEVIVQRLAQEGRDFLDAFVAQEQTVIAWNQSNPSERLVAIYPAEGTLWADHPLALLELGAGDELAVTDNQRRTFRAFADFLAGEEAQRRFLALGYRPANLAIPLDGPGSPFAASDAVDWRQPQTTLQMPSAAVVDVVQNAWWYTKRPTNVYLVVDTSSSMAGIKLERTRAALRAFVSQIRGNRDRVGLVEFGSEIKRFEPLRTMSDAGRAEMLAAIDGMEADGFTALLDAVYQAYADLQVVNDQEAINAIVVMTDGQENDSDLYLDDLAQIFQEGETPVVVFTIAFGDDADEELLQELARIGNGQFRRADETDIEELYRIISTYF